jgi:hypothetical protein
MKKDRLVLCPLGPSDQQSTKSFQQAMRAYEYPAARTPPYFALQLVLIE